MSHALTLPEACPKLHRPVSMVHDRPGLYKPNTIDLDGFLSALESTALFSITLGTLEIWVDTAA